MKRCFKLTINSRTIIDINIEGDEDLVNSFVKEILLDSFGNFPPFNKQSDIKNLVYSEVNRQTVQQIYRRESNGRFAKV